LYVNSENRLLHSLLHHSTSLLLIENPHPHHPRSLIPRFRRIRKGSLYFHIFINIRLEDSYHEIGIMDQLFRLPNYRLQNTLILRHNITEKRNGNIED